MNEPKAAACCDAWSIATNGGHDSEGWGPLIQFDTDEEISIGYNLPPVRFCPWCGQMKTPKDATER